MNLPENWLQIVEDNNEIAIIPFLQKLDEGQKRSLLPQLGKTAKAYLEIKDRLINNKHYYTKKASNKQDRILNYSIFVCIPDQIHPLFKWLDVSILFTPLTVDQLISWHCPQWFNDFLNAYAQQDYIPKNITYDLILQLTERRQIQPSQPFIAKLLPNIIFRESAQKKFVHQFQPQQLVKRPITLAEHIWYLFDYPTNIYNCDRYYKFLPQENLPINRWFFALKTYADTGQINRLKLLKACLIACANPSFNKLAVGWFARLFDYLQPRSTELLASQNELFAIYEAKHSKVINTALKAITEIVGSVDFQVTSCLKNFDRLLITSTKSIVHKALVILEKLAKIYPKQQKAICVLAAKTLVQQEENLQLKAAKLIHQYRQAHTDLLKPIIQQHAKNLFQKPQSILEDYTQLIPKQIAAFQKIIPKKVNLLRPENKISSITTFKAFQNLTLQIFDNLAVFHFDQFLASILKFQAAFTSDKIDEFAPVFKRAYQLVFNELPSSQGMLENILAIFFLDWGDYLIGKYPKESHPLQTIAKKHLNQGFFIQKEGATFDMHYAHLFGWYNPYDPSQVYMPTKKLLGYVLSCLHQGKTLPLLSTPTHSPTWIDPNVLVERLVIYQNKGIAPNPIDCQIAISRIAFENEKAALALAKNQLNPTYFKLISFLLQKEATFPPMVKNIVSKEEQGTLPNLLYLYYTAAITKHKYTNDQLIHQLPNLNIPTSFFNGAHKWMVFWEERQFEEWNHKTQRLEYVGKSFIHRELQIKFPKGMNIKDHPNFLYQYFPGNDKAFRPNINDVQRLLGLLPNNPDPLFALLIADNLKFPEFWETIARKRVIEMINWLNQLDYQSFGPSIHLFIGTCMLSADKEIRLSTKRIWKNAISQNQLEPILLGQILGKLERKEFAPLKRFADLAHNELFKISTLHNQALEQTIAHLLAKLPAIPIKNTKKLLVLYRELLTLNQSSIKEARLLILLPLWMESASLKKVIKELAGFVEGSE